MNGIAIVCRECVAESFSGEVDAAFAWFDQHVAEAHTDVRPVHQCRVTGGQNMRSWCSGCRAAHARYMRNRRRALVATS